MKRLAIFFILSAFVIPALIAGSPRALAQSTSPAFQLCLGWSDTTGGGSNTLRHTDTINPPATSCTGSSGWFWYGMDPQATTLKWNGSAAYAGPDFRFGVQSGESNSGTGCGEADATNPVSNVAWTPWASQVAAGTSGISPAAFNSGTDTPDCYQILVGTNPGNPISLSSVALNIASGCAESRSCAISLSATAAAITVSSKNSVTGASVLSNWNFSAGPTDPCSGHGGTCSCASTATYTGLPLGMYTLNPISACASGYVMSAPKGQDIAQIPSHETFSNLLSFAKRILVAIARAVTVSPVQTQSLSGIKSSAAFVINWDPLAGMSATGAVTLQSSNGFTSAVAVKNIGNPGSVLSWSITGISGGTGWLTSPSAGPGSFLNDGGSANVVVSGDPSGCAFTLCNATIHFLGQSTKGGIPIAGTPTFNADAAVTLSKNVSASFTINNQTAGSFKVNDPWTLHMTSNSPNASFQVCGVHDGVTLPCTNFGTTDASGNWTYPTNAFSSADVGAWVEWMFFPSQNASSNNINFTVSAAGGGGSGNNNGCTCTGYTQSGPDGTGGCLSYQYPETRTCTPTNCLQQSTCTNDPGSPGTQVSVSVSCSPLTILAGATSSCTQISELISTGNINQFFPVDVNWSADNNSASNPQPVGFFGVGSPIQTIRGGHDVVESSTNIYTAPASVATTTYAWIQAQRSYRVQRLNGSGFLVIAEHGTVNSTPPFSITILPNAVVTSVTVSCLPTSIQTGGTSNCSAVANGVGSFNPAVTWSVSGGQGTIVSTGPTTALYTAPSSAMVVPITARSVQSPGVSGQTNVTVTASGAPLSISVSGSQVPVGIPVTVTATGGCGSSYSWTANGSAQPTSFSGNPFSVKDFIPETFQVTVMDACGATKSTSITTIAPSCSSFTANPPQIVPPQPSTLSWSCQDAVSCVILANSNPVGGARPSSGSAQVFPSQTTTYQVSCVGAGAGPNNTTLSASRTVIVGGPIIIENPPS